MEFEEILLPAHFAPYLINGDGTGITEHEADEIDHFLHERGLRVVGCPEDEPVFHHSNDFDNLGADCYLFTAEKFVYAE